MLIPQRYEFSSKSQHSAIKGEQLEVVADTTKVRIFKQITTLVLVKVFLQMLLLIPQRYEFSSKSQLATQSTAWMRSCCWYHKGTNFQANHNWQHKAPHGCGVVADTTKVRIFKQITTEADQSYYDAMLLLIPQRYEFSSKSQQGLGYSLDVVSCCWYHKGTNFQANHNRVSQQRRWR